MKFTDTPRFVWMMAASLYMLIAIFAAAFITAMKQFGESPLH